MHRGRLALAGNDEAGATMRRENRSRAAIHFSTPEGAAPAVCELAAAAPAGRARRRATPSMVAGLQRQPMIGARPGDGRMPSTA